MYHSVINLETNANQWSPHLTVKKFSTAASVNLCEMEMCHNWAPFQYPIRRLIVRSRKVSNPRDLYLESYDRSEIWQRCRCACQISNSFNYQSRGFETLRAYNKTSYRIYYFRPAHAYELAHDVYTGPTGPHFLADKHQYHYHDCGQAMHFA